jgi:hypothetical protein
MKNACRGGAAGPGSRSGVLCSVTEPGRYRHSDEVLRGEGETRRRLRLLRVRPILSLLLGFACCFTAVHGAVLSPSRTEQRIWLVYMVVGGSCYAVAAFLLSFRYS